MRCPEKFDAIASLGSVQCSLAWGHGGPTHQWSGGGAQVSWLNERITTPSGMTTERVRTERAGLDERLARLQSERAKLRADWALLQRLCPHPDAFVTSHQGESCRDCPDCGACLL